MYSLSLSLALFLSIMRSVVGAAKGEAAIESAGHDSSMLEEMRRRSRNPRIKTQRRDPTDGYSRSAPTELRLMRSSVPNEVKVRFPPSSSRVPAFLITSRFGLLPGPVWNSPHLPLDALKRPSRLGLNESGRIRIPVITSPAITALAALTLTLA